jgi:hypothetical protein
MKWTRRRIRINQRHREPIEVVGVVSPSRRWHVRRAHPSSWAVTHLPTELLAFSRDGLRRDTLAWLDELDARLGPVTDAELDPDITHQLISRALSP